MKAIHIIVLMVVGKKAVEEWDKATKGKKFPKIAPKKKGK